VRRGADFLAACVGGTTNAGIFTMPWEQPRGPTPAFARQVVAYPTHEQPGTIIRIGLDRGRHDGRNGGAGKAADD
jgi:lipoprotein-anchoring transpeptidase ErfK/SrfK